VIAIVGFGQMGASLAAAWRPRGIRIVAIDLRPDVRREALERGWADVASDRLESCAEADAVLLAVPVRTCIGILPEVASTMSPGALLLDVASTKGAVLEAWRSCGSRSPYVSLHPLAGNEGAGIASASPSLFRDAPCLVLPVEASGAVVGEAEDLVRTAGARPIRIESAAKHDSAVAVTIHLPHALAYALTQVARESGTDLSLAGRSFRDSTRVALSDVTMVRDFLLTNGEATAAAIDRLIAQLGRLRESLTSGDEDSLSRLMEESKEIRRAL